MNEITTAAPKSIAALEAGGPVEAIAVRTVEEAFRFAQMVIRGNMVPVSFRDKRTNTIIPETVASAILKGSELGLPPMASLAVIAVINGRPAIWGDGLSALALKSGKMTKITRDDSGTWPDDNFTVTVSVYRTGFDDPFVGRFSVADAKRAKLWGNPKRAPWMEYPQRMLFNRARAFALRDAFADVLQGLGIREEVEDIPAAPEPVDASFLDDVPLDPASKGMIAVALDDARREDTVTLGEPTENPADAISDDPRASVAELAETPVDIPPDDPDFLEPEEEHAPPPTFDVVAVSPDGETRLGVEGIERAAETLARLMGQEELDPLATWNANLELRRVIEAAGEHWPPVAAAYAQALRRVKS